MWGTHTTLSGLVCYTHFSLQLSQQCRKLWMNKESGVFTPLLISIWHLGNIDQQGIKSIQHIPFFKQQFSKYRWVRKICIFTNTWTPMQYLHYSQVGFSGNVPDLYMGGMQFQPQPGHQESRPSIFMDLLNHTLNSAIYACFHVLSFKAFDLS
jgi:hypothetical protein